MVTANAVMSLQGFDRNTKWRLMLGIIKNTKQMQIAQTGTSGAISMTVEILPSHAFPTRLGRAVCQRDHTNKFN